MASASAQKRSWVPWWLDPYSESFIAVGILFTMLMVLIIAGLWIFRALVVGPNAGAHPVTPPSSPTYPELFRMVLSALL
jgi:hypothetical protein